MKKALNIIIVLFILISSCKRDPIDPPLPHIIADQIQMGNVSDMRIQIYDTLIDGGDASKSIELDINDDNKNDLKLISSNYHSLGCGYFPKSIIQCMCI